MSTFGLLSLQQWSELAEIVTGIGVLLVLCQVAVALRTSRVELITGMTTLIGTIDQAFIEYPTMRRYFRDHTDVDDACPQEQERARAVR